MLAGGPAAQVGKGFKAITVDAGGPEALAQAGDRLEAVVLDTEGLQAVREVAGCPGVSVVRPEAPSAVTHSERGLQAVLADAD